MVMQSRRHLLKAAPALVAGIAVAANSHEVHALVAGQNFDIITWKRFLPPKTNFETRSTSYISTNMPTDSKFFKMRPDTFLWMICNLDFHHTANSCTKMAMVVDGKIVLIVAQGGAPNTILTCSMSEIYTQKLAAGIHHCFICAAVNPGNSCVLRTSVCSFTVLEITLPARQT